MIYVYPGMGACEIANQLDLHRLVLIGLWKLYSLRLLLLSFATLKDLPKES